MQLTIDRFFEVKKLKEQFSSVIEEVHDELNEHLASINQNSYEIQANYDFIEQINQKLDKLSSRMDELELTIKTTTNYDNKSELNDKEKEVFLVLYTSNEPLSFEEIAARASLPIYVVEDVVAILEEKKIPVVRKNFAGKVLLILDERFKEMQNKIGLIDVRN